MDTLGQYGPISVQLHTEVTGTFTLNVLKTLNKPRQPCVSDKHYSYNKCLRNYVTRITNCSIDVLSNKYNCTHDALIKFFDTLNELKLSTRANIVKNSGCLPKCIIHKYHFQLTNNDNIKDMRKDWISSFYLSSRTSVYPLSEEAYSYDDQVT